MCTMHRAHVAQIRPQYDTMVCGSVIHKYVALVVGLGPKAGSPGRTTRDQPPFRPPIALSGAPGVAPSTGWPVGPSAEHLADLERLQVLIGPSLAVSAKPRRRPHVELVEFLRCCMRGQGNAHSEVEFRALDHCTPKAHCCPPIQAFWVYGRCPGRAVSTPNAMRFHWAKPL
eukprot:COSAG02_NODE_965_length_15584_cov_21.604312_11_plen_172_part_00